MVYCNTSILVGVYDVIFSDVGGRLLGKKTIPLCCPTCRHINHSSVSCITVCFVTNVELVNTL